MLKLRMLPEVCLPQGATGAFTYTVRIMDARVQVNLKEEKFWGRKPDGKSTTSRWSVGIEDAWVAIFSALRGT